MMAALVLAVAATGSAAAGPGSGTVVDPLVLGAPEVQANAAPSQVRLGQQITIVVTATYGAGVEVNLPDPLFPAGAPLEVAGKESTDRVATDGRKIREWQIRTYAWELGEFDIPPIGVTFTAGGKAAIMPTNSIPIRVVGVLGDADDPKLARASTAPVPLWRRSWMLLWIAGGVLGAIAAVLYTLAYLRRRKQKQAKKKVASVVKLPEPTAAPTQASHDDGGLDDDGDPHAESVPAPPPPVPQPARVVMIARPRRKLDRLAEEALAKLRAIEASGRLDTDRRGAYRDMVAIIREYLGARFDVDALELTTRELCQALMFRSAEAAGLTRAWLADCDLVKYAGKSATGDEARGILDGACWLVDRTSPGAHSEQARA